MTKEDIDTSDTSSINPADYWKLLSNRPVSVPVVAAEDDNGPAGFLALSVSHLSSEPPAMSVAVGKSTNALATIIRAGCFAISYLPEDASETAQIFGGLRKLEGSARFATEDWDCLKTGAPVFKRAFLVLDCILDRTFEYHQTIIAVGIIRAYSINHDRPILVSYGGKYRTWQD